jgi:hypothetical protein
VPPNIDPPTPLESHRRRLAMFARWLVATMDASDQWRESIVALARRVDLGGISKAETLGTLDALDDMLSEVWDKRPEEE